MEFFLAQRIDELRTACVVIGAIVLTIALCCWCCFLAGVICNRNDPDHEDEEWESYHSMREWDHDIDIYSDRPTGDCRWEEAGGGVSVGVRYRG